MIGIMKTNNRKIKYTSRHRKGIKCNIEFSDFGNILIWYAQIDFLFKK